MNSYLKHLVIFFLLNNYNINLGFQISELFYLNFINYQNKKNTLDLVSLIEHQTDD